MARGGTLAGVVLFSRNVRDSAQWGALIAEIDEAFAGAAHAPIVAVDQEGGPVQRLKPPAIPEATAVPAMGELARLLGVDEFEALGEAMGRELAALGVNVDFAPVLDVDTNPDNPIIGRRAFGEMPAVVSELALAWARGLARAEVAWCGKHFPGHGDTVLDSHLALPRIVHGRERLDAIELPPFAVAVAAGAPMIMTAHVIFEALDATSPATLSAEVVPRILRRELGYDGVVVSDDLDMRAIRDHYDVREVAAGLGRAQIDLAMVCYDLDFAEALAEIMPEDARAEARVARLRARLGRPRVGGWPRFPEGLLARWA